MISAREQVKIAYQRFEQDAKVLSKNIAASGANQILNNDLSSLEELLTGRNTQQLGLVQRPIQYTIKRLILVDRLFLRYLTIKQRIHPRRL